MRDMRTSILHAAAALLVGGLVLAAPAQEPERGPRPRLRPELTPPPLRPEAAPAASDPQQEMLELFRKVETRLREIDALLVDAGAGDTRRLREAGPAGIDQLIRRSLEDGRQNLRDIDRIIEIAQQLGSQQQSSSSSSSSSGEGQQGQSGDSPTQRGQQSTQRESTPEGPGQQPRGNEQQPGNQPQGEQPGDEPGGEQPGNEPEGEQPGADQSRAEGQGRPRDGGQAEGPEAQNRPGDEPPGGPTGTPSARPDDADRWGDLPVKVRDVFRHEGSEELPPQYRDWIDAYYRRLQREGRPR
jgi:hypothetical protein